MQNLSPMMQQYFNIKEQYPDTLLFFRLGDFYEMFFEDAKIGSRELELVLTARDCGSGERAPMCGVPFHSAESYIARLVSRGYKVAVCEQTEDPALAKGLVNRDVIRVITPGTVIESSMLEEGRNNYLAAVWFSESGNAGLCFFDISTGEVRLDSLVPETAVERVMNELGCYAPSEVLLNSFASEKRDIVSFVSNRLGARVEVIDDGEYTQQRCSEMVNSAVTEESQSYSGLTSASELVQAFGSVLIYLEQMQKSHTAPVGEIDFVGENEFMQLDLSARRNLELCETQLRRERRGSLLWVLDRTKTAMGKRLLRSWIEQPLMSCAAISRRQNAVEELCSNLLMLDGETELLSGLHDIERIMTRVVYGSANAKELRTFASAISRLGEIKAGVAGCKTKLLHELYLNIDTLTDIRELIETSIADEPPLTVRDGGMIRPGFNAELDELHEISENGKDYIKQIEQREQEITGIKKLRVGYNRVFGYYIEILNTYKDMVPDTYIRKQTLTNAERYITQELKELEAKVLGAQERIVRVEFELFSAVLSQISLELERVRSTARAAATLDVLCSLARVAADNGYIKPDVDVSDVIIIKDGRHPVVEQMLDGAPFVPNDTVLDCSENRTAIITGPNMAGKSTYMRQVALITLMAQIGSFVPASSAHIGIVDKIFTRVGASDDLSAGQSTFMLEMTEVASILAGATKKSLIVFDEIGRGTSTYDGMSIARSVLEYTNNKRRLGAKTLFATHYHELTELESTLEGVKNYNITVKRRKGDITFLRRIVRGPADGSYGIEVAALAGVPQCVVENAREILEALEAGQPEREVRSNREPSPEDGQLSFGNTALDAVADELRGLDINTLTPIEALTRLYELVKIVNGE